MLRFIKKLFGFTQEKSKTPPDSKISFTGAQFNYRGPKKKKDDRPIEVNGRIVMR